MGLAQVIAALPDPQSIGCVAHGSILISREVTTAPAMSQHSSVTYPPECPKVVSRVVK
jgi:hypothetical protein